MMTAAQRTPESGEVDSLDPQDAAGRLVWEPPSDARATTRMGRFLDRIATERGVDTTTYAATWEWSVTDLSGFWEEVADEFDVRFHAPPTAVLGSAAMPGADWFPGATLNYAEHALRHRGDAPAIVARSQTRGEVTLSFDELAAEVGRAAAGLRALGVGRGDRVVAILPNVPEAIVTFLACASIGAVFTSCAPEFGTRAVVDRVAQVEPSVLVAVDGYRYGDRRIDRTDVVAEIRAALPTLRATVVLPYLEVGFDPEAFPDAITWQDLLATAGEPSFEPVPFAHPLYVLYSSGTTGIPKAIVHGHGGITLEHVKMLGLHHDLGPGDRFCWFTTTGWMMWNYLVSGLVLGSTLVLFDGDPAYPDLMTLWDLAAEAQVTVLGVSAPFLMASRKAGLTPGASLDLSALKSIGSTAAPLPATGFTWVHDAVSPDVQVNSASGGTDVCSAFVAAAPLLPVHAGEIPARCLGAAVAAYDAAGRSVVGEVGELVVTAPMPSMPVAFWGDDDGAAYREAYFVHYPGVWRHGDWLEITARGSRILTGRSDATLNRGGVRMGTSEFYAVVESLDEVADSLVVHVDDPDLAAGRLVLFVRLAAGGGLDAATRDRITGAVRAGISPRHVPDDVVAVPAIPRTISGKKLEVPVKRLLQGEPLARVVAPEAMADPRALDAFVAFVDSARA